MHRKLKHNCNEAVKNRTTTQTSFDPTYGFSVSGNPNSTTTYEKVRWNIKETEEEKALNEVVFHGFLAIGTLGGAGSEAAAALFNSSTEPPTPTFEETTQITDQDLKLISKELEKFLEAEEASEDAQSSKRSKEADHMAVKNEEASLSEVDLQDEVVLNASHKKAGSSKAQFAKNLMKKMFKSLNSNSKSKTHAAANESAASTKKKFPKVLKMFKKKVHPEKGAEKDDENRAIPVKGSTSDTANIWFRQMISPQEHQEELIMRTSESCRGRGGAAFMENNGHWIKTDADSYDMIFIFFNFVVAAKQIWFWSSRQRKAALQELKEEIKHIYHARLLSSFHA
nr:protein LAZY 1-like [Ipomoea batatas]